MGDLDFLKGKTSQFEGWTLDIFKLVIGLGEKEFSLGEIYAFEPFLKEKYPLNNNIKAQIRKQLQILGKKDILGFYQGGQRGRYSVICRP